MKKLLIQGIFITSLVVANLVTGKILNIMGFIIPGAFLLYAFTFLMTDLMSELYGKKEAVKLVQVGFITSVFSAIMVFLTQQLPAASFAQVQAEAYDTLLGMNYRVVFSSMGAYYLSQTWDVWIFHKLGKITKGKFKWVRNNVSTMTSQFIDTAIFITIAFIGNVPSIGWMILSQYVVKLFIAAVDTPIFYLLTRHHKNNFTDTPVIAKATD